MKRQLPEKLDAVVVALSAVAHDGGAAARFVGPERGVLIRAAQSELAVVGVVGAELMAHFVTDEIDVIGVALGLIEARDRHGFHARLADGAQHAQAPVARAENVTDIVMAVADFPVDDLLALLEESLRVAVGEGLCSGVQKDDLVVVGDQNEFDGHLPSVDLVDAVDRRDDGGFGFGLVCAHAAALVLRIFRRAAQGQTVGPDPVGFGGDRFHGRTFRSRRPAFGCNGRVIDEALVRAVVALVVTGVGFTRNEGIDVPGAFGGQHLGVEAHRRPVEGDRGCGIVGQMAREGSDIRVTGGQFRRHDRRFPEDDRNEPSVGCGQRQFNRRLGSPRYAGLGLDPAQDGFHRRFVQTQKAKDIRLDPGFTVRRERRLRCGGNVFPHAVGGDFRKDRPGKGHQGQNQNQNRDQPFAHELAPLCGSRDIIDREQIGLYICKKLFLLLY